MTSRNGTARSPSRYPTNCTASRTDASGSTPADPPTARPPLLGIPTVAGGRIDVLPRTEEQGEDQPGPKAAHVGEEGDAATDRPDVQESVERLQRDPVADKHVCGQRENEKRDDEREDARAREVEDVDGQQAGDGAARPQHRDGGVWRDVDL